MAQVQTSTIKIEKRNATLHAPEGITLDQLEDFVIKARREGIHGETPIHTLEAGLGALFGNLSKLTTLRVQSEETA